MGALVIVALLGTAWIVWTLSARPEGVTIGGDTYYFVTVPMDDADGGR
jgi:hypothetical protein